ncbi:hypothetical protein NFI95_15530 [Acetobacteraceae bacterium KSS8]|uniref:LysM domain-containing protein n=1 Tax=Endosaccharibacter trunci TaxID=2812733 RepID=A0ABT1WBQ1_9PROT|nr:hypothetical protein [Acetobacteraceae bacterium KSS8]
MPATAIVSAADVSLEHVAARVLGNPLQWWQIAALNGLTDPSLASFATPVTLTLPVADTTQTNGISVLSA